MNKKILLLGASVYYIDTIKSVKELGYEIHILDRDKNAIGFDFADKYEVIDFSKKYQVLNYAKKNKIDAIMPLNDFGTRSAFFASQKLGLISPSYISGIASNDKGIMRDIWNHDNLPQPEYFIFNKDVNINNIVENIGFPMVVKPTDTGGAGRGITVAYNIDDLKESIKVASEFAKNNRYIAESFIEGTEVTVESLVYKNINYVIAISDKVKAEGKSRVAISLNYPSFFDDNIISRIKKIVSEASDALGINYGATHTELIVSKDKKNIYLVEMGARPGGSHIQGVIIKETSGIDFPKEIAKILCDESPNLVPLFSKGCVYKFFNPKEHGVIKDIIINKEKLKNDDVVCYGVTARKGDIYTGMDNSMKRIGYIIVKGKTREEAICNASRYEKNIEFIIE